MHARLRGRVRVAVAVISVALNPLSVAPSATALGRGVVAPETYFAATPESSDWLAGARRSISEREYEATDAGAGLQAPNRAQGLRTYFDATGARVVDRENEERGLTHLRTVAVGRGEPKRVADGEVTADGARVEIRRAGLVETFENTELGLEQSWTLTERPVGEGSLTIDVAVGGTIARVEGDGATVMTAGGRRLEYGGLAAWDAAGTALAVRMEAAADGRVRILVDDAGAAYPVTIDPTLSSPVFTTLSPTQVAENLGESVASAGDVNGDGFDDCIVGASLYDAGQSNVGAAFIFLGGPNAIPSGSETTAATVLQSNQAGAGFGFSVAGAGDVNDDGYDDVVVGAYGYDSG